MTVRKASILDLLPLAGLLPLLADFPYLVATLGNSPVDRFNWVLLLAALLAGVTGHFLLPAKCRGIVFEARALWVVAAGVLLLPLALFLRIHAACQVAAVLLTWGLAWLVHGWKYAWKFLPLTILWLLGITGALLWLEYLFGRSLPINKGVQLLLGGLCGLWWLVQLRWEYCPPVSSLLFALLVMGGLWLAMLPPGKSSTAAPCVLTPGPDAFPHFLGREIPLSDGDRRFFAKCRCSRWCFASEEQPEMAAELLAVEEIRDVHAIHSARYCLRMGGYRFLKTAVRNVAPDGAPPLFVEEFSLMNARGKPLYGWVWYSNTSFSTPSYVLFRLKWRLAPQDWHAYQLFVEEGDADKGCRLLQDFLF